MEFMALDSNFTLVSSLAPTLVQWNRKYYECGDFEIQIQHEQYEPSMKYIYTKERPEMGIINKVIYDTDTTTLKGFFLNKLLDDKIVYPTFYGSGDITSELAKMVQKNKEDIRVDIINTINGSKVDFQSTGDELSTKMYELLATQEMSYNFSYDYENDKFILTFYRGLDKTTGDDIVTFSSNYGNLIEPILNEDDSNYKNYALVAGQGQKEERIITEVDLSNGGHKRQLFVDARDMPQSDQSLEQYKAELRQRGLEKLADRKMVNEVSFKVAGDGYEYMKDYDLGYKVYGIIEDIKKEYSVRIIGIYEVFKQGLHTLDIEIGNMKGA